MPFTVVAPSYTWMPYTAFWTVTQSVFQRTARVATVSAATPAGNGVYSVVDIDADEAWALAEALTPGITDVWHHTGEPGGRVSPSMGVRRG